MTLGIVRAAAQRTSRPPGRAGIGLVAALLALGAAVAPVGALLPAAAAAGHDEVYPVPPSGIYHFHGRGFGHGHGMSQWGAYGAAKVYHLSSNQILHFYYPHTTLATKSTTRTIRVLLTAADAPGLGYLQVEPAAGLALSVGAAAPKTLPTRTAPTRTGAKAKITGWRLRHSGSVVHVRYYAGGKWHLFQAAGTAATLTDTASEIRVIEPGRDQTYRGAMVGELESGSLEAVNVVNLEQYLLSVVPSEMSPSWSAAALQAQAVASRTYARHGLNHPKASWYDVDGDPRDQGYGGVGVESPRTTKAIEATAGEVIVGPSDRAIFAQYSSSDGGWTVSGGEPYLPAERDPYDGAIASSAHAWTTAVPAASLVASYPQLGTLSEIEITGRDGDGAWGGRVTALKLVGTKATVDLSGSDLQFALGLRSPWFRPVPTPAAPSDLTASATGSRITATWKAPSSVKGAAKVSGYAFALSPGGHDRTLSASALTASVGKLAAGTYTVTVEATSSAGAGPPAKVRVTIK